MTAVNWEVTNGELNDLLALDSGLTGWELRFVEDMACRRDSGAHYTARQREKIGQIWDKCCG